jgi:hypothetical protein
VIGGWRKLSNEELHGLYSSSNIVVINSRMVIWSRYSACMREMTYICLYKILVGKPEGNRPVGRPERRWEDNIYTYLKEIGWIGSCEFS